MFKQYVQSYIKNIRNAIEQGSGVVYLQPLQANLKVFLAAAKPDGIAADELQKVAVELEQAIQEAAKPSPFLGGSASPL